VGQPGRSERLSGASICACGISWLEEMMWVWVGVSVLASRQGPTWCGVATGSPVIAVLDRELACSRRVRAIEFRCTICSGTGKPSLSKS
jgi:hypothetical protein